MQFCYGHEEGWDNTEYLANPSLPVAASPRTTLEMVKVKFWRYDPMIRRLVHTFMLGTREMRNFRTIKISMRYTEYKAKYGRACTDLDFKCVDYACGGFDTSPGYHVKTFKFY